MKTEIEVTEEYNNTRIDHFLTDRSGDDFSRSTIQKWIKNGYVKGPSEKKLKPNYLVTTGEKFVIEVPPRKEHRLIPVKMDIEVIRDFENYMIINKPAGVATHAGPGDDKPSLVNGLLYHFKNLSSDAARPGIVHRLDKPTSGLLIIAKNDAAHLKLSRLFHDRAINKTYYAWVQGSPGENGTIDLPIGRHKIERLKMCIREDGRNAVTRFENIKTIHTPKGRKLSLVKVHIETGRTHQIRVHFQNKGCPVIGDMLYSKSGPQFEKYGLLLFAQSLSFTDPFSGEEINVELDFPEKFKLFEKEAPVRF